MKPADEDDPAASAEITSASQIPLDFKLKVAKDVYNSLTPAQKDQVNNRREEDRKKLYRSIPEIEDGGERNKKLLLHKKYDIFTASYNPGLTTYFARNQPSVPKSLFRVLKNLEDQAGCVAQLFVAHVDPKTGATSCQK